MSSARDCRKAKREKLAWFPIVLTSQLLKFRSVLTTLVTVTTLVTSFGKTNSLVLIKIFSADSEDVFAMWLFVFFFFLSNFLAREFSQVGKTFSTRNSVHFEIFIGSQGFEVDARHKVKWFSVGQEENRKKIYEWKFCFSSIIQHILVFASKFSAVWVQSKL